ncbi:MAG: 4-hydroxythreonine-4-phosphate dehydrogenase PdxA [Alphaproteobacteria bacterium]|nr:4-hydroxythreonine-4-phosphate dehydrogenase PdxA [Alphaproteobacteria bacterium]
MARGPIAITMGEPAGIGGEILLKAWNSRREFNLPSFFAVDDPNRLRALGNTLGMDIPVAVIDDPAQAPGVFADALPVIANALPSPVTMGQPNPANTDAVVGSIAKAVAMAMDGSASAVVTNPIHKAVLYAGGFKSPGHTEFLGELTGSTTPPVMMLACPGLRVVPVSIHIPLAKAVADLNTPSIVAIGQACAKGLRDDFGIDAPRIAVAGLNPHAGEGGALGSEDDAIVAPAVEQLRAGGIDATGPHPPDAMFHDEARDTYDLALCMYHDQALIPLKTLNFRQAINVTLGLPIVRTSPGHGVALAIAGTGNAHADSLVAAITWAGNIAEARGSTVPGSRFINA